MQRIIKGAAVAFGLAAVLGPVHAVSAGSIQIELGSTAFEIQSSGVAGVFGAGSPNFTTGALDNVHEALHNDGVNTDGVVTIIAVDTDHGLSIMALVDDSTVDGWGWGLSALGVVTHATSSNPLFINDVNSDVQIDFVWDDTSSAFGTFAWNHHEAGDGIAWANLQPGDWGDFWFGDAFAHGLENWNTYQFVSFDSNAGEWAVVHTAESNWHHSFDFDFHVVPLPAATGLGAMGLAIVGLVSWRRKTNAADTTP